MTTQPKRSIQAALPIQYRDLDDVALTEALVGRDEAAWREFVRRFDLPLRRMIGRKMARAMRLVIDSDAIDDVMGDFYLCVVQNDMRKLRVWLGGGQSSLVRWLAVLARGIAIDHIRFAFNHQSERTVPEDDDRVDPRRVAKFEGAEKAASEPRLRIADPPRQREFVWFGDEWVLVYDEGGREIDRFLVGAGWRRKPKPSDIHDIVNRRIKAADAQHKRRRGARR